MLIDIQLQCPSCLGSENSWLCHFCCWTVRSHSHLSVGVWGPAAEQDLTVNLILWPNFREILSFYVYHLCCVWQFILSQLCLFALFRLWLWFVLSTGPAGKCVGAAFEFSTATSKSITQITQNEWFVWWSSPFSLHKWFMNIVQNSLMWPLANVICKFLLASNSWSTGDHSNYHSC